MPNAPITLLPRTEKALSVTAERILQNHHERLPDLSSVVVILPDLQAAPRLRRALQQGAEIRGHSALLGPTIETLSGWLSDTPIECGEVPGSIGRELMLVEALREHNSLFGTASPWLLCDSLIELFDELTLQQQPLPDSLDTFTDQLTAAYALTKSSSSLGREAKLVHTLWQAWHEQHQAEGKCDVSQAKLLQIAAKLTEESGDQHLYLCGSTQFKAAELELIKQRLLQGQADLILQGALTEVRYHPDATVTSLLSRLSDIDRENRPTESPFSQLLNTLYNHGSLPIGQRAEQFAASYPESPVTDRIKIVEANGSEQEAIAVDIQVRRWLLHDKRESIAVVTEDRRLARRVRALLERSGITINDSAGWALSTTSAAAALERWLETVEEDFAQQPLIDLLKSPFVFPEQAEAERLATLYRLEQDIIQRENIARGLERYRRHLHYRQRRLNWSNEITTSIEQLLDRLADAAGPLLKLIDGQRHKPERYLEALQESMKRLGMSSAFDHDLAGARVSQVIATLLAALPGRHLPMEWEEFRVWLGRSLETHNFRLRDGAAPVELISLAQSTLGEYDGVIIAGCDQEHLPGSGGHSPFFNDQVRRELGLTTRLDRTNEQFHHFRNLLEAAPAICLTLRREQDGEEIIPSPWLESLRTFHLSAYDDALLDQQLMALLNEPRNQMIRCDTDESPAPVERPTPQLPRGIMPESFSASSHQRLIDCPYRFFAADGLRLKPLEEIREALAKSDYGERVHRCLQAFHGDIEGLPGPYREAFTKTNRQQALELLIAISNTVFASDLEDNFQHRGWLRQWLSTIPSYIDWQIDHAEQWRVKGVEQKVEQRTMGGVALNGRLDRIDQGSEGLDIIDYKSGGAPKQIDVESGEAVQLPTYAMLMSEPVNRVEYLMLDSSRGTRTGAALEGDDLTELALENSERLEALQGMILEGHPLTAWGDNKTCSYCEMDGICRKAAWNHFEPDSSD
ncbi:hypothetical protein BOW53_15665 [Solemya pervernicosa gill symbiont]|uniref:PD-(D/E)XK endonuclease-like domain-containing protein n=1 Tax=Solemya pervernicosa gill symbiont TaxID=642797 RepID=A0A1T2KZY1_9GAMM|nr:hypothetical protein BOW53_15665 [Solemya pervernicosa gill symbiont]